jgi:hypothetical protein
MSKYPHYNLIEGIGITHTHTHTHTLFIRRTFALSQTEKEKLLMWIVMVPKKVLSDQ